MLFNMHRETRDRVISFPLRFHGMQSHSPHGNKSMAHSTAAATAFSFGFLPPVIEKLTHGNYGMWYAQVSSTLKGAQLAGYIKPSAKPPSPFLEDGTSDDKKVDPVPNPEYEKWEAKDQQVLSYLFGSLSKEIFAQVSTCTTAAELWAAIQAL